MSSLEEATAHSPSNARILNDLGAAYLVRGERATQTERSLQGACLRSIAPSALDRSLTEAWFNRAYALERLSLTGEARDAWQAYLTIDDRSGWADEARVHLRALSQ